MNLQRLKSLLNNDEHLVKRFIGVFTRETPKQLTSLGTALKAKQFNEASLIAHAIKSQLRYMGLDDLAAVAAKLEKDAGTNPEPATLRLLYQKLRLELEQIISKL